MKVLSVSQTRAADLYTIEHEPISSWALMERAANALFHWFQERIGQKERPIYIFCGTGNNGGDGLALARMLHLAGWKIELIYFSKQGSEDYQVNLAKLPEAISKHLWNTEASFYWPFSLPKNAILVDAIFGTGLSRPLEGYYADLVHALNMVQALKISVDIPTGLFADSNTENNLEGVFRAHHTLTFQHPKASFLHAFTAPYCGQFWVLDIGLSVEYYSSVESDHYYLEHGDLIPLWRPRQKFSYKGTYGHLLQIAGSEEKLGAALISARAAAKSGCGLLTAAVPASAFGPFNAKLPEAMLLKQESLPSFGAFSAIMIGPGLGTAPAAQNTLKQLLQTYRGPLLLDADALNMLAENRTWLSFLPSGSVLTPHPGEAKRLLGVAKFEHDYLARLAEFCQRYKIYLLLKDAISVLINPAGKFIYSDFGTPALAKGGSGDCLAGIISALMAQAYPAQEAVLLGLFLHGRAAQRASRQEGHAAAVLASEVIDHLGWAMAELDQPIER